MLLSRLPLTLIRHIFSTMYFSSTWNNVIDSFMFVRVVITFSRCSLIWQYSAKLNFRQVRYQVRCQTSDMKRSAVRHLIKNGWITWNRLIKCAYVSKILTSKVIIVPITKEEGGTINDTPGKNLCFTALLNSIQKFIEKQGWLLLTFLCVYTIN